MQEIELCHIPNILSKVSSWNTQEQVLLQSREVNNHV